MAQFHPSVRPEFLSERLRDAESEVWESFRQLDNSWHVFYSARANSESGYDREVDFILIRFNQIFYCEVKGGVVQVDQRFGPGVTWKHFKRSGEPIERRVDPQQLLNAKAALNATIRTLIGTTPRELRFVEHHYYIFPHTPRDAGGADLERGAFHYAFAEDMVMLPYRLRQIVESRTGAYVHPDKISAIIAALNRMVIKGGGWPDASTQSLSAAEDGAAWEKSSRDSPFRFWRYAVLGGVGLFLFFRLVPPAELTGLLSPSQPAVITAPAAPSKAITTTPPNVQSPARKASQVSPERAESALPIFIPSVAFTDVEQAVMLARDIDANIPWRTGSHHGFVTLIAVEPGGCRRWRISRNDLALTFDFVRRC